MVQVVHLNCLGEFLVDKVEQGLHQMFRELNLQLRYFFDCLSNVFRVYRIALIHLTHKVYFTAGLFEQICLVLPDW